MLNRYANHLYAAGRSAGTVHLWLSYLEQIHRIHPDLLTVTTADLEAMLSARRETHAADSRKSLRSAMRSFYGWAARTKLIDENPAAELLPVHVPRLIPRLAPDDEIQTSLITATTQERAMILLGRLGCLRLNEITTLHTKHREGDLLRVTGKGSKQRMVPLNDDLMHVVLTLERETHGGWYFEGRYGGHMHSASVGKIISRVTGWNPHSLRHAGATAAYRATRNLRAVQELLGHASLATTERYLHVGLDEVRSAAAGTAMITPLRPRNFPVFERNQISTTQQTGIAA